MGRSWCGGLLRRLLRAAGSLKCLGIPRLLVAEGGVRCSELLIESLWVLSHGLVLEEQSPEPPNWYFFYPIRAENLQRDIDGLKAYFDLKPSNALLAINLQLASPPYLELQVQHAHRDESCV